jgi:hypothetical protein
VLWQHLIKQFCNIFVFNFTLWVLIRSYLISNIIQTSTERASK